MGTWTIRRYSTTSLSLYHAVTQQKTGSFPRVCRFAQVYKPCTLLHTSWETLVHCLEMNPSFQTWKLFVHGQFTRKCTTWKPTMFLLCNTTSPPANETCPEIVVDVNDFENEIAIFSEVEWSDYAYVIKCMCILLKTNTILLEVIRKKLLLIILMHEGSFACGITYIHIHTI